MCLFYSIIKQMLTLQQRLHALEQVKKQKANYANDRSCATRENEKSISVLKERENEIGVSVGASSASVKIVFQVCDKVFR